MFQADLNNRVAAILSEAETKLREVVFAATKAVVAEEKILSGEVQLVIHDGLQAAVNSTVGSITVGGLPAGNVQELLHILDALHHRLGEPLKAVEVEVAHVVDEVKAEVVRIEDAVEAALKPWDGKPLTQIP